MIQYNVPQINHVAFLQISDTCNQTVRIKNLIFILSGENNIPQIPASVISEQNIASNMRI